VEALGVGYFFQRVFRFVFLPILQSSLDGNDICFHFGQGLAFLFPFSSEFPSGIIRSTWKDKQTNSMAPAQG
jgi:hypothetical protein